MVISDENSRYYQGRLIKNLPGSNQIADMGETRERIVYTPEIFIPLIDTVERIGWHDCNTAYAIDHGKENHTNLLFVTLAGGGNLTLDGVSYPVTPGTMTVIPNDTPTSYSTDPECGHWEFYWMHVRGINVSNILQRLYQNHHYLIRLGETEKFSGIFDEILNSRRVGKEMALFNSMKVSELLHLLIEETFVEGINIFDYDIFTKTILQYIEVNYQDPIDVNDLAALVYVTPETVIRTFKKHTGYTPHAYIKMYRMMMASNLLSNTDLSVKVIATMVGYRSASNFSAEFRNIKGVSPTQFRNQYKKKK